MKPTTGLALLATAFPFTIIGTAPAAAAPGKDPPGSSARPRDAMPGLGRMLGIDLPRDREDGVKTTGNGKGNQGNGKGNDGDNIPNGKGWGWWKHHHPHPVSP